MSRLIDADALKKYMDDCGWCDNCPDKKRLCEMDCRFPDLCTHEWQRVIDEQPTITASPWHRVEEPPKEEGKYLVYDGRGNYHVAWWGQRLGWCYDPKFFCYWMPIEPPKEDA